MATLGRIFAGVLIVSLLGLVCGALYWLFVGFPEVFSLLPATEKVTLITGAITIIGSTAAVMVGRSLDKKRELDVALQEKKIPIYDSFLKRVVGEFQNTDTEDDDLLEFLHGWHSELLLWGNSSVVKAYGSWMTTLKREAGNPMAQSVHATECMFRAIRKELGHDDNRLEEGDLLFVILRNPELFVGMSKKNPNVSLAEIAKVENELERRVNEMLEGRCETT